MKKIMAFLLALMMLFALAACGDEAQTPQFNLTPDGNNAANTDPAVGTAAGTPEEAPAEQVPQRESFADYLAYAQEQMQNAESFHMDMVMDLDMTIELMGQSMNMEISTDYSIDSIKSPMMLKMEIEMVMSMLGQTEKQSGIYYAVEDEDGYKTYMSSDGGVTWTKSNEDSIDEAEQQQKTEEQMELFMACADTFQEIGREDVNGAEAILFKGKLSGDYVEQAIQNSGSLDSLGDLTGGEGAEAMMEDLGEIDVTIAFDMKTGYILYYEMDMAQPMGAIMTSALEQSMASQGTAVPVTVNMSKAFARVDLSQINAIDPIEIPEAALAA